MLYQTLRFNPVQAGKGSASGTADNWAFWQEFQSRPSREGFCKRQNILGVVRKVGDRFNPVQAGKGSARTWRVKRGSPRTVSIPSKPGRVLQDLRGTVERGHAAVSIPSKPGRVLQEEYEFAAGAVVHVSIPSKPGRVLQAASRRRTPWAR